MRMRISRRHLGALGLSAVLPTIGRAAEPKRGGTLVIALDSDPPTVNPDVTTSVPDVSVGALIYDALMRVDEDFAPVPALASSWTVSPDKLTYTFKLVEAAWHDGKPFTSKDVKFTFESVSGKYGAKFATTASVIDGIDTPDDRTVVFRLKRPFGPFLFSLTDYNNASIMPEHVYAGTNVLTNPATLSQPIGTGPFMMKEWDRGQTITLARNPNYWREGKPYLDEIVFRFIPDAAARVLALKAGELDFVYFYYFPTSQYVQVKDDPNLQFREHAAPEDHLIMFNVRRAPFDNVKVRQALFTALDREYIKKAVFQDLGTVMQSDQLAPHLGAQPGREPGQDVSVRPGQGGCHAGRGRAEARRGRRAVRDQAGLRLDRRRQGAASAGPARHVGPGRREARAAGRDAQRDLAASLHGLEFRCDAAGLQHRR